MTEQPADPAPRLPAAGATIPLSPIARLEWPECEAVRGLPATVRRLALPGGPGLHLSLGPGAGPGPNPPRLQLDLRAGTRPGTGGLRLLLRIDAPCQLCELRSVFRLHRAGASGPEISPIGLLHLRTGLWQEVVTPTLLLDPGGLTRVQAVIMLGRNVDVTLAEVTALQRTAPGTLPAPGTAPAWTVRPVADLAARRAGPVICGADLTLGPGGPEGHVQTDATALAWRAEATGRTGQIDIAPDGRVTSRAAPDGRVTSRTAPDGRVTSRTVPDGGGTSRAAPDGGGTSRAAPDGRVTSRAAPDGGGAAGIVPPLPPGEVLTLLAPDGAPLWTGRVPAEGDKPVPEVMLRQIRRAEFRLLVAGHVAAPGAGVALLVGGRVADRTTATTKVDRTNLSDAGAARLFRLETVLSPAETEAPVALRIGDGPPVPLLVQGPDSPPPALPPPAPPPEGATAQGAVTRVTPSGIEGWAVCRQAPDAPVTLRLSRDGTVLAETRTRGRARGGVEDTAQAAPLAFRFALPPGIAARGAVLTLACDPPGALEGLPEDGRIVLPPPAGLLEPAPAPLPARPAPGGPAPADTVLLDDPGAPLAPALRDRLAAHLGDPGQGAVGTAAIGTGAVGTGGLWLAPHPVPVWHPEDTALPCAALEGAMMLRRATWEAMGGLDPALPGALARADLCLRLHEAGLGVACLPDGPAPAEARIRAGDFLRHLGARARRLLRADREGALTGTRPRLALLAPPEAAEALAPALQKALPCHLRLPPDPATPDLTDIDIALATDPALAPRRIAGAGAGLTLIGWTGETPADWTDSPLSRACDRLIDTVPALARRAPAPLRIAIANSARNATRAQWGDAHFADSLAAALRRLGHVARVDDRDHWRDGAPGGLAPADDATIALRGLHPCTPRPGQVNVMWLISHPDAVSPAEIARYDHACIASAPHAAILERLVPGKVSFLAQCTDTTRFTFDPARAAAPPGPPLYVANSRNVFRDPVRWALARDLPLEIHGRGWEALSDDLGLQAGPRLRDRLVPNEVLGQLYGAARLVACDHWADMARLGYVSNRVFDVLAAGGRLLVDAVAGLEDLVPRRFYRIYASEAEFAAALSAPPPAPDLRAEAAAWVAAHHSFDDRAALLVAQIEAALIPGTRDLPSPGDSP